MVHKVYLIIVVQLPGRMACDVMPFSTVFQSYQVNGRIRMKASRARFRLKRFSPVAGIKPGTARSAGKRLTY